MDKAKIEALKNAFGGPMTPEQGAKLRDMQAWVDFCIDNGINFLTAVSTLAHDVNGLLQYQEADWFRPKTHGYAEKMANLTAELTEMANEDQH